MSDCLRSCPADGDDNKGTNRGTCIVTADIGSTCTKDTCISSTYAVGSLIGYVGIGVANTGSICARSAFVGDVEPRALAGSGILLAGPRVIDYCLWLLMRLVFVWMNCMSC